MASISDVAKEVVRRVIRWASVESVATDSGPYPVQQVRYLGRSGKSAAWYPFGFHASAEPGSLALLLAVSGVTDARVHLPGSSPKRPELESGEVAVYHPKTGTKIVFKNDGTLEVTGKKDLRVEIAGDASVTATGDVTVTSPTVTVEGDAVVTGSAQVVGDLDHDGLNVGFHGATPIPKATITGAKAGGPPQTQLLAYLEQLGLIVDSTT